MTCDSTTRLVPTALRVKRKAAQMSKNEAGPVPITAQELDAAHAAKHANTQTTSDDTPPADKSMVDEAFSQFMVKFFFFFTFFFELTKIRVFSVVFVFDVYFRRI